MVVEKQSQRIICTSFCKGAVHDFKLFKTSRLPLAQTVELTVDSGYLGIDKFHAKSRLPKKKSKRRPLTPQDKRKNRELARQRVLNEHVIGRLKRFKVLAQRYRNRRSRFGLRFNLIAGFYNFELEQP